MNKRKPVDYTNLYAQLETALCRNKNQMDQYAAIGKAVALRPEKGAAVAAAGYIREAHPELSGFSPRNLRRMRAFTRPTETIPTCWNWRCGSAGPAMC